MPDEYFFFLSYAREDGDEHLKRFKKDLEAAVSARTAHPTNRICFRDRAELEIGDVWLDDLSDAIRTCYVFVPVLTLRYFTKDFCGKEWAAFKRRVDRANPNGDVPRLIVPVLWISKDEILSSVPATVGALQFDHEDLPQEYSAEGLRYLLKVSKHEADAGIVVEELAKRIVALAKKRAPHLPDNEALDAIESAWKPAAAAAAATAAAATVTPASKPPIASGPRYVQFVFVAAGEDEIRRVRARTESYGEQPLNWKPFNPDVSDEIAVIAQQVAADQKFFSELQTVGVDLVKRISDAESGGTLVAMIVDTWTLQVGGVYDTVLRDYDGRRFSNCAVLVPWNPKDEETTRDRAKLEQKLLRTLTRTKSDSDPRFFVDQITTPDQFREGLTKTLATLRAQVARFAEVQKQAVGEAGETIPRPII